MITRHAALSIALLMASAGIILPAPSLAASVYGITGDDLQMNTLGSQYIHSRHTGLMPYWGPCYRCKKQEECSPQPYPKASYCAGPVNGWAGNGDAPDAQWIYGTTNCRNAGSGVTQYLETFYNNNTDSTIQGTAWYAMNDFGAVYVNGAQVASYSDVGHTGAHAYPGTDGLLSSAISLPPGKDTIVMRITNGSGSSYGILQVNADINGTEQPIITSNPSTWYYITGECPVEYERVCGHYGPQSTECTTPPTDETLYPDPSSWACNFTGNPLIGGWYQDVCQNPQITAANAQWIYGANDGATGVPQSAYSVMQATFDNTLGNIQANLTFLADNIGWVWINGQQVAYGNWESENNSEPWSGNVSVPAGQDTIDYMVMNYPSVPYSPTAPANNPSVGILALTASTGQVLIQSNASNWDVVTAPPTTPDPTPQSLLPAGYTPQNCAAGGCG
ncbi:hypothetical protein H7F10_07495 [Acidithiobacillus sp. HP-6]|uniref:hypothetical protein n=1 Tax=unclassified Acidithiobacillus TaxID=2614800 RepID=UPI00187AFFBD|nr:MULTISPECIES: hypothetical protein [unclassified Acidithiobacillus]MBE7562795.1 hypothetical protein [Acidithiobacillus sp. HP-6]MBE7568911.1 hypothetical protein [Acidithiobacillus sp. HP-2]